MSAISRPIQSANECICPGSVCAPSECVRVWLRTRVEVSSLDYVFALMCQSVLVYVNLCA